MIHVKFFASLREQLGQDQIDLPARPDARVGDLLQQLIDQGEPWAQALQTRKPMMAVNQTLASSDTQVHAGDEVAFFPPVTGG